VEHLLLLRFGLGRIAQHDRQPELVVVRLGVADGINHRE
jgi:hypothetical protein